MAGRIGGIAVAGAVHCQAQQVRAGEEAPSASISFSYLAKSCIAGNCELLSKAKDDT
jgi:hypothetical protein